MGTGIGMKDNILVPGIDACPKCGALPLIYEYLQNMTVCRNCKTQAYELERIGKKSTEIDITDQTPFGEFEVKCKKCGSTNVDLDNSMGWSEESGGWGSLDLMCQDCGNRVELMEP